MLLCFKLNNTEYKYPMLLQFKPNNTEYNYFILLGLNMTIYGYLLDRWAYISVYYHILDGIVYFPFSGNTEDSYWGDLIFVQNLMTNWLHSIWAMSQ